MPNSYDPYRDAQAIETQTVWPADLPGAPSTEPQRQEIAARLHSDPAQAAELQYVRLHTGFVRKITVTAADLERLRSTT